MAVPAIIAALIAKEGIKAAIKKFGKKAVKEATDKPINKLSNKSKAEMAAAGTTIAAVGLATSKDPKKKKEVRNKKPRVKPLSARPLLAATQRRIDYERAQKAKNNKEPEKKAGGGMMKKGYAKGGAVRKQSKPRGVGAATRGFGKEMR